MSPVPPDLDAALTGLRAMHKTDRTRDLTAHIEDLLRRPWSKEDAYALRRELIGELHLRGRHAQAEALLRAEVERDPGEPFHSYSLAEHFHYYDVDLQRSLEHIALAIAKARIDGKFMFAALGVQARLAVETRNWPLLESTLRELVAHEHSPGKADTFPETDFLSRVPQGAVSPALIEAYARKVANHREKSADNP